MSGEGRAATTPEELPVDVTLCLAVAPNALNRRSMPEGAEKPRRPDVAERWNQEAALEESTRTTS